MDAESLPVYVVRLAVLTVLALPWVIAVGLLWSRRRAAARNRRPTLDASARLLAAAVRGLPEARRDWGAAMTAELAQLDDRASRRRFAIGCVRAAVFPPRSSWAAVLAVAAAVTAWLAVGHVLPAMRVFAVTFIALAGAVATFAVAGSRRPRPVGSVSTVAAAGLAGTIALTVYVVVKYPTAADAMTPGVAVFLAVLLAACTWLVLTPPRALTTSRLGRRLGVAAALAFGAGFALASRHPIDRDAGVLLYLLLAPPVILFAGSAATAAISGSFRAGIQAAVWSALLGALLIFLIGLPEALRWYETDGRLHLDGELFGSEGQNLVDYIFLLALLPAWGLPFGVIGARVGSTRPTRNRAGAAAID
jgi:hypothetical protein